MSTECLPFEVVVGLLRYLGVSDLLAARRVCRVWRDAASLLLARRVTIMITDDVTPALDTFSQSSTAYHNWVFKEVEVRVRGGAEEVWAGLAGSVTSLHLLNADLLERDFLQLLGPCVALEELTLGGLPYLLMTGTLLSNPEDQKVLSAALRNVTRLHLACSRYLTDQLFSRVTSVVGPLTKLSLAGCLISFQSAIHKRFYPADGRVQESDHVLTFQHILAYVSRHAATLKDVSLGRTTIDSESLHQLAAVPGLQLDSLHLMSCDQLSRSGIEQLCQHQPGLKDLDLSLCSRVTDLAVLAICQRLTNITKLNLRRCQGVTENGVRALRQLRYLEELNISHLDAVTSDSVEEALGREPRPSLRLLNVASLPLSWRAVVTVVQHAPNLTFIDLSMCTAGVNDKSVQAICKNLPLLQHLNVSGCVGVTDIGLAGHGLGQQDPDSAGPSLTLENLGVRVKDPFKVSLGSRAEQVIRQEAEVKKYLKDHIHQIVNTSEYGLSNVKGLRELNLCGCLRVTDITLVHALRLPELRHLNLSHCQGIGEEGLVSVAQHCPSLEVLMLADCGHTSDRAVLVIAHHLRRIKTLDLQSCYKLTDDALDSLGGCGTLQYLDVSGCDRMSLEGVRLLQAKIPRLHNLHHRGIKERGEVEQVEKAKVSIPPPPPMFPKKKLARRRLL